MRLDSSTNLQVLGKSGNLADETLNLLFVLFRSTQEFGLEVLNLFHKGRG